MNHTQNYNLSQWVKSDQVKMEDFNADNAKIDTAIKAEADARAAADAALTTELSKRGNCRIWTTTYTGNGQTNISKSVSFPKTPKVVFVLGGGALMCLTPAMDAALVISAADVLSYPASWSGSYVSWNAGGSAAWVIMNVANVVYTVAALLEA